MARLLIADDDPDYLRAFRFGMEAMGHDVQTVDRGNKVENALTSTQNPFDAVFLDVMMPEGGAVTVLHSIRKKWPSLPVIVITGRTELFDSPLFRRGMRSANAHVRKTASLEELDGIVRRQVSA